MKFFNDVNLMLCILFFFFTVWAWKSCYVYTAEVQAHIYLCYTNLYEVLMKVLYQTWPIQRLFVSS